jgi:uncharacterized protein YpuA (DUF1002 family)
MKLNKTQIDAIAEKAVRDLRTAFIEKCEKAKKSYVPSEKYEHIKELFSKEKSLNEQLQKVRNELYEIRNSYNVSSWTEEEVLLNEVINEELQIQSLNFLNIKEDIKTDLTIGTIDSSFDPYKFIEETVSKYLNS